MQNFFKELCKDMKEESERANRLVKQGDIEPLPDKEGLFITYRRAREMDKTIETKFFEAFKWGGVVDNCIEWMRRTYNLPPMKPTNNSQQNNQPQREEEKAAKEKWELFYKETLPKKILEETESFDDSVIMYNDSPLMNEIEANLSECKTDEQRERYLFSLLKPFGDIPTGCGIARIYTPTAEINRLKEDIKELEKDKTYWETMPKNEQLRDISGKPSGTPKEQIEACNNMINRRKEQIDWVLHVNHQFCNLTGRFEDDAKWMQTGTVESCLSAFVRIKTMLANRLDALLLTYGIDLMKLQKESGLYLKDHRLITDVDCYIGSIELAKKYIDALPKEPQPKNNTEITEKDITLPSELDTEKARKYFAKAINVGYMKKEDIHYKWMYGGEKGQARLGYFCNKIYSSPRPINKLEEFFGVKKLSASITNADNEAKRADVKKWRNEMNNNIFND